MGWVDVTEPFAAPPTLREPRPTGTFRSLGDYDDRGYIELTELEVRDESIELGDTEELTLNGSVLANVRVEPEDGTRCEVRGSAFTDCDLSRLDFATLRTSTLIGTKLVGTDFSAATVSDVVFDRCVFRHTNFRMAALKRVRFESCVLDDVDFYETALEDVDFAGSELNEVNLDKVSPERVDLRHATTLGLKGLGRLAGFLISEAQVMELAYALAFATGLGVEQVD